MSADNILKILETIAWPTCVVASVAAVSFILRAPLSRLLDRIRAASGEGKKWSVDFSEVGQKRPESLPKANQTTINQEDVKEALLSIPDLKQDEVESEYQKAHYHFLQRGVVTVEQLQQLTQSTEIIGALRSLYLEMLKRPPDKPLDPIGIAVFAPLLFAYGVNDETVMRIRRSIMSSPEYREKNARNS